MACLLKQYKYECRVRTVLNKNNRSYGKQYMFDDCPETCWNSDAGKPQWVIITFEQECKVCSFEIEFQGGFVGRDCYLEIGDKEPKCHSPFYPQDNNSIQRFYLKKPAQATTFKFIFNESTDFFEDYSIKKSVHVGGLSGTFVLVVFCFTTIQILNIIIYTIYWRYLKYPMHLLHDTKMSLDS